LVNQSLLRRTPDGDRFEIHELIRQYAEQKLSALDYEQAARRYIQYYADFCAEQFPRLQSSAMVSAQTHLREAMDNIRKAWMVAVDYGMWDAIRAMALPVFLYVWMGHQVQNVEPLMRAATDALDDADAPQTELLGLLLVLRGKTSEPSMHRRHVDAMIQRSLDLTAGLPPDADHAWLRVIQADALNVPGHVLTGAERCAQDALAIFSTEGHVFGQALAYYELARIMQHDIRYPSVSQYADQSLQLFKQIDHPWGLARVYLVMANYVSTLGDVDRTNNYIDLTIVQIQRIGDPLWEAGVRKFQHEHGSLPDDQTDEKIVELERQLVMMRQIGTPSNVAWKTYHLGYMYLTRGDYAISEAYLRDALAQFSELGDFEGESWSSIFLAQNFLERHDYATARQFCERALRAIADVRFPWSLSGSKHVLGQIAYAEGDLESAYAFAYAAVMIAYEASAMLQTYRHLVGVAQCLYALGNVEQALTIVAHAIIQEVSDYDTRKAAHQLMAQAAATLSEDMIAAAQHTGRTATTEAIVAALKLPDG